MAPKKKMVSKKAMPKTIEDMPNVTMRRPTVNDHIDDEIKDEEYGSNLNVTVVLGEIPDSFEKKTESPELKLDIDEKELNSKTILPKKIVQKKRKTKKTTLSETNTVGEDCEVVKVKEKVVSRSRKRPVEKEIPELSKSVSPIKESNKRNKRAASVDIIPSYEVIKNVKDVIQEEKGSKKIRKGIKKESSEVEKTTKTKKITKKMAFEEKGNSITPEKVDIESNNVLQVKPKSKRVVKKEQTNEYIEDIEIETEKVPLKQTNKTRGLKGKEVDEKNKPIKQVTTKSKHQNKKNSPQNSEESSAKHDSEDSDIIAKTPELKIKRVRKGKVNKLHEESSEKNTDEDSDVAKMLSVKTKRICKGRQVVEENNVEKSSILVKRGARKVKGTDFEEIIQKSPPVSVIEEQNIKTGDLPDGLPDNPESGKNEYKPAAVKRKIKAKK